MRIIMNYKKKELDIAEQYNKIISNHYKEEHELKKEELRTKDRADVSLKDYELLVKERNKYEELSNQYMNTLMKIVEPLKKGGITPEALDRILNGEFEFEVKCFVEPEKLLEKCALIFSIEMEKML